MTTVIIVDDHAIVREGLRMLLDAEADLTVVAEGSSGDEAIALARQHQPDVMLLDIRMPDGDGLHALPQIKSVSPNTQVLMLTTHAKPAYLAKAVNEGATGFLSKGTKPTDILQAVRTAAAGQDVIDREVLQAALKHVTDQPTPQPKLRPQHNLTEREVEVLQMLTDGMGNADIADKLNIGISTVKTHIRHILEKLGVPDRMQAALWAVRNGLVS